MTPRTVFGSSLGANRIFELDQRRLGRVSAELRPLQDDLEQKLARLRAAVRIGGGSGRLKPFEPLQIPGVSISDTVPEDRKDRF